MKLGGTMEGHIWNLAAHQDQEILFSLQNQPKSTPSCHGTWPQICIQDITHLHLACVWTRDTGTNSEKGRKRFGDLGSSNAIPPRWISSTSCRNPWKFRRVSGATKAPWQVTSLCRSSSSISVHPRITPASAPRRESSTRWSVNQKRPGPRGHIDARLVGL